MGQEDSAHRAEPLHGQWLPAVIEADMHALPEQDLWRCLLQGHVELEQALERPGALCVLRVDHQLAAARGREGPAGQA